MPLAPEEQRIRKYLPENAARILNTYKHYKNGKQKQVFILGRKLQGTDKIVKYSKPQFLYVYQGYDFLENLIVIRPYICRKYNITMDLLELLLKLAPATQQYFNLVDYYHIPKRYKYMRLKWMIENDYIIEASKGKTKRESLFRLSKRSRKIVVHFYRLLAGEEKIPEEPSKNPIATEGTEQDRRRMALIKMLNGQEPPETKKKLFAEPGPKPKTPKKD